MKPLPTDIDFLSFLGLQEYQYIQPAANYFDEVIEREKFGLSIAGESLPWEKTYDTVRLRPGEVTIWAGVNGHGKSLMLGQVLLWLESETLIASLEMKPAATLQRMCHQALGNSNPSDEFIRLVQRETGNIWIYDETSKVNPERILGMCVYAATELKIKHIMIDSLMKCGINPDDYNRQKDFIDRLCWCAKTYDTHIHLVHHIRKSDREGQVPDKFDIKGAGEITDLADNVFLVHRNKDKENNENAAKMLPDQYLIIAKQRHGEWEGRIGLYFHKPSQQYTHSPDYPERWRGKL